MRKHVSDFNHSNGGIAVDVMYFVDKTAIDKLSPGDAAIIFTPDSAYLVLHCLS